MPPFLRTTVSLIAPASSGIAFLNRSCLVSHEFSRLTNILTYSDRSTGDFQGESDQLASSSRSVELELPSISSSAGLEASLDLGESDPSPSFSALSV